MNSHNVLTFIVVFVAMLYSATANAALSIDSVYPNTGKVSQDLTVTIRGKGFNGSTRVSMSLDTTNTRKIIGSVDTPNSALDITIVDQTAYVADGGSGLQVIDISDPQHPAIIGFVDTPGAAYDITIVDQTAYVADDESGLQIIDISDPQHPAIIGSVDTPDCALGIAVGGQVAYVADFLSGLQVIDISDPQNPAIIGSVDTPGWAYGVAVAGQTAYVADRGFGLQVIDISDPPNPAIIRSVNTPGFAYGITVVGETAYVADGNSGLQVIDITDPQNPAIIGSVDTPGDAWDVTIAGQTAYVADGNSGICVIDISDPQHPAIIGSVDTPGDADGIAVVGQTAYVADWSDGLQVIDVIDLANPAIIGSVDTPGIAYCIAVVSQTAYVADGNGGLQVINITDPQHPAIIGSVDTPGYAWGVTVVDQTAYGADGSSGLQIIDISDPKNPAIIGSVDTPGDADGIAVAGQIAYVVDGESGICVIDISDPQNPAIIGSVDTPGIACGIAVAGQTAYVADGASGLQVIDISDPQNPAIIGSVDTPNLAQDIAVADQTAYVADWFSGLQVIDIYDPQNPAIIGSVDTPGKAYAVTVAGQAAYMADFGGDIQIIDISFPQLPAIIGSVDTPGWAYGVTVAGQIGYVADGDSGLSIVPLPQEITPVDFFSSTELRVSLPRPAIAGYYNLRVFNVYESESDELTGAVTFFEAEDYEIQRSKKVIIAAGGSGSPTDRLTNAIRACANYAYLSLISQGYLRENIYYLSPYPDMDVDGDGILNDVDDICSSANLSLAISDAAADASELIVYLVDHGGTATFEAGPSDILQAADLDAWLDAAQAQILGKVILIYDACYSGSFLPNMSAPPGKERIVITSCKADESAWFMNNGVLSFSYQFWASVFINANLYDSFLTARNMMSRDQTCILDADGDGLQTKQDIPLVGNFLVGRGRIAASSPPSIGTVCGQQTLNGNTSATLWANNIISLNEIRKVWAIIVPPNFENQPQGSEVTGLDTVLLEDPDEDGKYTGVYNNFIEKGTYSVTVHAEDTKGYVSMPSNTTVIQEASEPDVYEEDDTLITAGVIVLNDEIAQCHNFHDAGDEDWVQFYALSGQNYTILASNLETNCDIVIDLYNAGASLLNHIDDQPPGENESFDWTCPQDGIYYVMFKNYTPMDFGENTGYDINIYKPIGPLSGEIYGTVKDTCGKPIGGAVIKTDRGGSALSLPATGNYRIIQEAGSDITVTATANGYEPKSYPVTLLELGEVIKDFQLTPIYNLDKDGDVDIVDIMMVAARWNTETGNPNYAASCDLDCDGDIDIVDVMRVASQWGWTA